MKRADGGMLLETGQALSWLGGGGGGAASWRQWATPVTLCDASCIMPYLPVFQTQRQSAYLWIFLECWSKNQSSKQKKTKNAA